MAIYHVISWGIPATMICILVGAKKIVPSTAGWYVHFIFHSLKNDRCHLDEDYEIALWIIPLMLTMAWNIVFYILIIRKIFSVFSQNQRAGNFEFIKLILTFSKDTYTGNTLKRKAIQKLSLLLLVFLLCWSLDMFNHMSEYFFGYCPPTFTFILQDFLAPLQGFLNALVYGVSNYEFHTTTKKIWSEFRTRNSRTASERASLLNS